MERGKRGEGGGGPTCITATEPTESPTRPPVSAPIVTAKRLDEEPMGEL
eukprot:COSAG01_NODE_1662_length_9555_cov_32.392718_7_plen_49_part_00